MDERSDDDLTAETFAAALTGAHCHRPDEGPRSPGCTGSLVHAARRLGHAAADADRRASVEFLALYARK
jgi:hypothetical protein